MATPKNWPAMAMDRAMNSASVEFFNDSAIGGGHRNLNRSAPKASLT